jgi:hypothetical protein
MRPESKALGQVLLDHHREITLQNPPPERKFSVDPYLIAYGDLCSRARVPELVRIVGGYLAEIADLCATNDWPPLNALAVNSESRLPGDGYDEAVGCSEKNWSVEVAQCIRFAGYPRQMP